jgi:hypothetical protein
MLRGEEADRTPANASSCRTALGRASEGKASRSLQDIVKVNWENTGKISEFPTRNNTNSYK